MKNGDVTACGPVRFEFAAWRRLWDQYLVFSETALPNGHAGGLSRLIHGPYWHAAEHNEPTRSLYDKLTDGPNGCIVYEVTAGSGGRSSYAHTGSARGLRHGDRPGGHSLFFCGQ